MYILKHCCGLHGGRIIYIYFKRLIQYYLCFLAFCAYYRCTMEIYIYQGFEIVHYTCQHIPCIVVIVDCTHVNNCLYYTHAMRTTLRVRSSGSSFCINYQITKWRPCRSWAIKWVVIRSPLLSLSKRWLSTYLFKAPTVRVTIVSVAPLLSPSTYISPTDNLPGLFQSITLSPGIKQQLPLQPSSLPAL